MSFKNACLVILVSLACLLGTSIEARQQVAVPQETITIYTDEVTPAEPEMLADRLKEVDAVIHCRVERGEVRTGPRPDMPANADPKYKIDVFTEQIVTVLEVIKGHKRLPAAGATFSVIQPVGEAVVGNVRVRRADTTFPPFAPGEEYVLFLQWDQARQRFQVMASDTFLVKDGKIESPGKRGYATEAKGATASDFLSRVRADVAASGRP